MFAFNCRLGEKKFLVKSTLKYEKKTKIYKLNYYNISDTAGH